MKAVVPPALALALGAWSTAAAADPAYDKCLGGRSTNAAWAACGTAFLQRLDAALNAAWKDALASLADRQSREQLREEQRAWLRYRDASCRFYANGGFGREGQVLRFVRCRGAVVEARIGYLKAMSDRKN